MRFLPWLSLLAVLSHSACSPTRSGIPSSVAGAGSVRTAALEAVVDTGSIGGAPYRIEIPDDWNGGLVVYAHGYEVPGAPRTSRNPQMVAVRDVFLSRGFAVAQSDYRTQGWAVAEAVEDLEAMRGHFVARYGRPDSTFVTGHSMGGHITIATIERHPEHYNGALPLCGPLGPALDFLHASLFDLLVSFDYLFPRVLPDAAEGLADADTPSGAQPQDIAAALSAGPEKAALLAQRFNIRPADLPGVIAFYYTILKELQQRAGGHPFDNTNTVYSGFGDDAAFNREVRRYAADPGAVAYVRKNYSPSGQITDPVLSVHTTYDPLVSATHVNQYAIITGLAGTQDRFVGRYVVADGHCAISPVQIGSAFDALREWTQTGARPEGGEVR